MRQRVNLLDIWVDKMDWLDVEHRISQFISSRTPHQIVTVNVDFLRLCRINPAFRDLVNTSDLVVPDGMPLVWAAHLIRSPLVRRITGIELLQRTAALSAAQGHTMFLLGAQDGVAAAAAEALRTLYPGVQIVGTYSPPVGAFSAEEDAKMVRLIQQAAPDTLFVAFGAPKQDQWIREHMAQIGVPVAVGVGGAFDMLAGSVGRAPQWMQDSGFEWFYRFIQEPGRLWKRYFVHDLPVFVRLLAHARRNRLAPPPALLYSEVLELHSRPTSARTRERYALEEVGVHSA